MIYIRAWSHTLKKNLFLVSDMSKEHGRPITSIKNYHPLGEVIAFRLRFILVYVCFHQRHRLQSSG